MYQIFSLVKPTTYLSASKLDLIPLSNLITIIEGNFTVPVALPALKNENLAVVLKIKQMLLF